MTHTHTLSSFYNNANDSMTQTFLWWIAGSGTGDAPFRRLHSHIW